MVDTMPRHPNGGPPMIRRPMLAASAVVFGLLSIGACGGSPSARHTTGSPRRPSSHAAAGKGSTTTGAGPDPNAPEVVAPGDIPDNQVFVAYKAAGGFSVKVPEGWARTDVASDHVAFNDKYNTVDLTWKSERTAPTEASAKSAVEALKLPGFSLTKVSSVRRSAGAAILVTYRRTSDPNAVTGKRVLLEVEQYEFWKNGKSVTLTLSGAKGADNVDPWKTVTDGFKWT